MVLFVDLFGSDGHKRAKVKYWQYNLVKVHDILLNKESLPRRFLLFKYEFQNFLCFLYNETCLKIQFAKLPSAFLEICMRVFWIIVFVCLISTMKFLFCICFDHLVSLNNSKKCAFSLKQRFPMLHRWFWRHNSSLVLKDAIEVTIAEGAFETFNLFRTAHRSLRPSLIWAQLSKRKGSQALDNLRTSKMIAMP